MNDRNRATCAITVTESYHDVAQPTPTATHVSAALTGYPAPWSQLREVQQDQRGDKPSRAENKIVLVEALSFSAVIAEQ